LNGHDLRTGLIFVQYSNSLLVFWFSNALRSQMMEIVDLEIQVGEARED
jgi:hypothetical protein